MFLYKIIKVIIIILFLIKFLLHKVYAEDDVHYFFIYVKEFLFEYIKTQEFKDKFGTPENSFFIHELNNNFVIEFINVTQWSELNIATLFQNFNELEAKAYLKELFDNYVKEKQTLYVIKYFQFYFFIAWQIFKPVVIITKTLLIKDQTNFDKLKTIYNFIKNFFSK